MYLKFESGIVDDELNTLREYLAMFDSKLTILNHRIKESIDPDAMGLCDQGEYLIGMGFAVCQRYLGAVLGQLKISKSQAFVLGPFHKGGESIASIVNAAANYWKHLEEWDQCALTPIQQKTIQTISTVTEWEAYTCSNVLAALSPNDLRLGELIPYLEAWRNEVDAKFATELSQEF